MTVSPYKNAAFKTGVWQLLPCMGWCLCAKLVCMEEGFGVPNAGHKKNRPYTKVLAGIILLLAAVAAIFFFVFNQSQKESYNSLEADLKNVQNSASFSVYIPSPMPSGFTYEHGSVTLSQGILFYPLIYSGGTKKLSVSQQSKPDKTVINDFYDSGLTEVLEVNSTEGKAVLGTNGTQTIGSLVTDKTWVFVTAPSEAEKLAIEKILANLAVLH